MNTLLVMFTLLSLCVCIDIVIADEMCQDTSILDQEKITFLLHQLLLKTGKSLGRMAHATIVVMNDRDIAEYNGQFRNKNQPTNVLAFPTVEKNQPWPLWPDHPILLGDIFISWPRVITEAAQQGKTVNHHAMHLLIHGFLHLLHYDHETEDEAEEMESLERAIFHQSGWPDPYAEGQAGIGKTIMG